MVGAKDVADNLHSFLYISTLAGRLSCHILSPIPLSLPVLLLVACSPNLHFCKLKLSIRFLFIVMHEVVQSLYFYVHRDDKTRKQLETNMVQIKY